MSVTFDQLARKITQKKLAEKTQEKKNDIFSITESYLSEKYDLRRNTISFEIEIKEKNQKSWRNLSFEDLFKELRKAGINIKENFLKIILKSSFVSEYNPFLTYYEGLHFQEKDYIKELCTYIDVEGSKEEFYKSFKKTLIRCVACSLGEQFNKQCFVLVSPHQNIGKTSFIKWLCPPELHKYYTEEMSFDKDGLIALASNFIINLDELSTLAKAELNTLKAYFSKDTIKVRLPYEPKATSVKRVANFFASTNNEDFLNDPTGSVRWVAFFVNKINFEYSQEIDVNSIWWQAYELYKSGETGKLTQEDIAENENRNLQFTKITPEMELLQLYTEKTDNEFLGEFLSTSEIQERLTQLTSIKINFTMLGKALTSLKYKRVSKRLAGCEFPKYGYYIIFKK